MRSKNIRPPVIPGRLEEPNPESRDSGFDAAHRPGMTARYDETILAADETISPLSRKTPETGAGYVRG
jgi:hypothetical protein